MSRVRDALKKANTMAPAGETGLLSEVFGPGAEAGAGAESEDGTEAFAASADFSNEATPLGGDTLHSRINALLRHRWVRKVLRVAGLRPKVSVQRCHGTTRMGQPCRGPAMANGYCRLHGGSRHGTVIQKTRETIERFLPAR